MSPSDRFLYGVNTNGELLARALDGLWRGFDGTPVLPPYTSVTVEAFNGCLCVHFQNPDGLGGTVDAFVVATEVPFGVGCSDIRALLETPGVQSGILGIFGGSPTFSVTNWKTVYIPKKKTLIEQIMGSDITVDDPVFRGPTVRFAGKNSYVSVMTIAFGAAYIATVDTFGDWVNPDPMLVLAEQELETSAPLIAVSNQAILNGAIADELRNIATATQDIAAQEIDVSINSGQSVFSIRGRSLT